MNKKFWWQKHVRYIQFNSQIMDAPKMEAKRIAEQASAMGAEAICMNTAGMAAWYPSGVQYEYINEFMNGRDMVREYIDAFHALGLKFIARVDFFVGAPDYVYHQKPHWFVRDQNGAPVLVGGRRPGKWPLLYVMCPNGGYVGDEVAVPLFKELIEKYPDIDAFFLCGASGHPCWCDICCERYFERYGEDLPDDPKEFKPDWLAFVGSESARKYYETIKATLPDVPLIRYYWPFGTYIKQMDVLDAERYKVGNYEDLLCTESQNVLSAGTGKLIPRNATTLAMKTARFLGKNVPPIGIIHTCPGMEWRHIGMPRSEFLFWAAQVPAMGGSIWASLTGVPDTNRDKRMISYVSDLYHMIEKVQGDMEGAENCADVLLLCDDGGNSQGWTDALMSSHIEFDILNASQFSEEILAAYSLVIAAKDFPYPNNSGELLAKYVKNGGRLIIEGTDGTKLKEVKKLLGVKDHVTQSEPQAAAYIRIEESAVEIKKEFADTELIPLKGRIGFCEPAHESDLLLTWIPPFTQAEFAGRPPEWASLPTEHTNVPLCIGHNYGTGYVTFVAFELGKLISEYQLEDFYTLAAALIKQQFRTTPDVTIKAPMGVITSVFKKDNKLLIHFVNGVGKAPLLETIPVADCTVFTVIPTGKSVSSAKAVIQDIDVPFKVNDGIAMMEMPALGSWEMLRLTFE